MSSSINAFSEKSRKEVFIKYIRFFHWNAYKSSDKELYKLSDNQLLHHILHYGIPKNTILFIKKTNKNILPVNVLTDNFDLLLPKDFDWNNYINLNKDNYFFTQTKDSYSIDMLLRYLGALND